MDLSLREFTCLTKNEIHSFILAKLGQNSSVNQISNIISSIEKSVDALDNDQFRFNLEYNRVDDIINLDLVPYADKGSTFSEEELDQIVVCNSMLKLDLFKMKLFDS